MLGPAQPNESYIAHAVLRSHRGVMLDIGAHHGSSLAPFAEDGWHVHAFEPDAGNRAVLESAFAHQPNVEIVPKAVAATAGEMMLFNSELSSGISSLSAFTDTHRPAGYVPVITMRSYLYAAGITAVDFMKIDVEGYERSVLEGYDWAIRPTMIVLEFEDSKTLPHGYSWQHLADDLVAHGYDVLVSEWFPVERYGGEHQWRRLVRYPTELADTGGWGNLIATNSVEECLSAAKRAVRKAKLRRRFDRLGISGRGSHRRTNDR